MNSSSLYSIDLCGFYSLYLWEHHLKECIWCLWEFYLLCMKETLFVHGLDKYGQINCQFDSDDSRWCSCVLSFLCVWIYLDLFKGIDLWIKSYNDGPMMEFWMRLQSIKSYILNLRIRVQPWETINLVPNLLLLWFINKRKNILNELNKNWIGTQIHHQPMKMKILNW